MTNQLRQRLLATTLLVGAGIFAAPTIAQTTTSPTGGSATDVSSPSSTVSAAPVETTAPTAAEPASGNEIVVTGSRIARPDLTSSSPVTVVTDQALKDSNTVTVEQILSANPQFAAGFGGASNNPGDGSAQVDLRGLGSQRTLVLIDGKRAPPFDTQGVVDVNGIPTALIKRVEVLTGGASSVYGSDAVAGVVNFVMNDRFKGLQADASSQISKYGDGGLYSVSLTGGVKLGERGNFIVSGNWAQRNGVFFGARPYTSATLDSSDLVSSGGSSNTIPTAFDVPGAGRLQVQPDGSLSSSVVRYSFNPVNYAQLPFKRWSVMGLARYDLTDKIEFYGRANYSRIKVDTQLAATATAGFGFNLDPTNPFLSAAERAAFFDTVANPDLVISDGTDGNRAGTSTVGIRRRIVETGGRLENNDTRNQQYVAGLRGDLGALKWDVFAQYGQSKKHRVLRNDLSYTALLQALDVVAGPGGTPQCFDPSNGCVPLNLFNVGVIPQSALAFVLRNALEDTKTSEFVTGASIGGDIGFIKSPFALHPAAFSLGVEYRREKGSTVVDSNYASGDLIYYGQGQNISGKYDVKEVFGELKLPLVEDRPGFYRLGLEVGARYSDYSTVGGVKTYKIGGDYAPVEGVRFRSIYQRAVRAPSLYELFSPVVAATGGLNVDPCQGAISGAVVTECLRQGAPQSSIGNILEPVSGQINIFYGGNPNLQAEKSDTFTAGVVLNPKSLRGFSASVDYYHIKVANAVASTPPSVILANCFASPGSSNPFCAGIVRNPLDGSLSGDTTIGVPAGLGNVGAIGTSGVDVAASYSGGNRRGFNYGLSFNGTYLKSYTFKPSADAATNQCAGRFGPQCDYEPLPKWRHVVDARLGFHPVSFTTRWRYFGSVHADPTIGPDASLVQRIKAYNYFDETVAFDITDRFTFRLGVLNLFDKKPPLVGDTLGTTRTGGGTFPNTYDVIGRSYFAGVTAKF